MSPPGTNRTVLATVLIIGTVSTALSGAERTAERPLDLKKMFEGSIPRSPFAAVVYEYADTLLRHGRDAYGPVRSGLFLSALDRNTLAPLGNDSPTPLGVRPAGRPRAVGSNLQSDQNVLRLLYFLKGLSGEDRYPQAADDALKWFLTNTPSRETGLLPWGASLSWNVVTDEVHSSTPIRVHELSGPWILWSHSFALAPEASHRFARALWNRHVTDQKEGTVAARAGFDGQSVSPQRHDLRHAGFCLRAWAEAYRHRRDDEYLRAIDAVLGRCEQQLVAWNRDGGTPNLSAESKAASILSLAIDADGAARKVPEPRRTRLTNLAARLDRSFCSLPHDLARKGGFVNGASPDAAGPEGSLTSHWEPTSLGETTAQVAMMCVSRYENTGGVEFRDLIIQAADVYLDSLPGTQVDAWPGTFGHAISLELAAFRITARAAYHRRATHLGNHAVKEFFGGSPLPRASLRTHHYESTTGAGTLLLALVDLHLTTLHITAVRAPTNTVDR